MSPRRWLAILTLTLVVIACARHADDARSPETFAVGKVSKASKPKPADDSLAHCPFPPESDPAGIDQATVMLELDVTASGRPQAARVLNDPGHGFGQSIARRFVTVRRKAMPQRAPGVSSSGAHASFW